MKNNNLERQTSPGVRDQIALETQLYIWNIINLVGDDLRNLNDIQVFNLFESKGKQAISINILGAEIGQNYKIDSTNPINKKILVVFEKNYILMVLAREFPVFDYY